VLVAVGLFIRLAVMEPAVFLEVKQTRSELRRPIIDAVRRHPRSILLAMGAKLADFGAFYLFTVFVLVYATLPKIGFSRQSVLMAVSIAAALELFTIPAYGALSDRLGRRPVYLFGAIFVGLFAFPFFWLIDSSSTPLMVLSVVLALALGQAAMYGPQASFFSELFGTQTRYSGVSLGYQTSSVIGGLCPIIATLLLKRTGGSWAISLFIMGLAAITTISVWMASETAHIDMAAESMAGSALSAKAAVQPIERARS
jgi:MHS family shikimate/dehydroshikimate transporter-like MFS transporter